MARVLLATWTMLLVMPTDELGLSSRILIMVKMDGLTHAQWHGACTMVILIHGSEMGAGRPSANTVYKNMVWKPR